MNQIPVLPRRRLAALTAAVLGLLLPALNIAQTVSSPAAGGQSTSSKDEALQLSTFTVTEEKDLGYESMMTTSGMRTVQPLKNVANSISIINAQFIEDLGLTTMEEIATWMVSGESNPEPNATVSSRVILRGVPNAYALRNGWIWYSPMDSYSTERVEELRGPNAFLYGEADVGGANHQITKRGLFTRNVNRLRLMVGSNSLLRAEVDVNRPIIKDKLALRVAAVTSTNDSWINNVRRDFRGVYGAVTYRPFKSTSISVMAEHNKTTSVNSQGMFTDSFIRAAQATLAIGGGYIYIPETGSAYRATGRVISTGPAIAVTDPSIVPKAFQSNGPNATFKNYTDSVTLEAEQHIGKNLHLQLSGNFYQQQIDNWSYTSRAITRDRSPLLPNGAVNPYYNELYTEYLRTRNLNGNIVRDMRISAVYDFTYFKWMKQQFIVNAQQHQDNPGQKKPKYGEYLDMTNPNWTGVINPAITQAAFVANRTTFTNNRFIRRFYLKDGSANERTGDLGPVPGVSAWYPDLSNAVAATGQFINRRFYTPSYGFGASGSYFNDHLFTMVGYRQDEFNMKTTIGSVRPQKEWVVDYLDALNPKPFVHYKVDGANYGGILRLNDMFAIGYNYAQSFRISVGEGAATYVAGEVQGIPVGEGTDISARLTFFKGKLEIAVTHYKNFTPNARFTPGAAINVRDELAAIFPTTFNSSGTTDYQTTTTSGNEVQVIANPLRNWRLTASYATNKVVNVDRAPLLHDFQDQAKALNKPTPLLNDFLLTIPEGLPNPGYTKARGNLFSHYRFSEGFLKGFSVGVGGNWRLRTYRGSANISGITAGPLTSPTLSLYSPAYTVYVMSAGYTAKIFNRTTTFNLNIDNLTNKEYYRSAAAAGGSWGDPRSFKLTVGTEF